METSNNLKKTNCTCSLCGSDFYKRPDKLKNSTNHICSLDCKRKYSNTKILVQCLNCNKDFYKNSFDIKKSPNNFCSRNCSASYNNRGVRRHPGQLSKCIVCDNEVRNSYKKYCSKECSDKKHFQEQFERFLNGEIPTQAVIKKYLFILRPHQCEICKIEEWCGQKVPLVLDHIDGNSENNNLDNLRLVCGNCDMQLPTYKSKNKGNGRAFRRQRYAEGKSY